MSTPTESTPGHGRRMLFAACVIIPLVAALALAAFAWPAARLAPRHLPIGVAGPAPAVGQIEQSLARRGDAFEIHRYADEAAARKAIEDRDVYGAVVASPQGPTVLTASAASPLVAQLLGQAVTAPAAGEASGGTQAQPRVVDVVPADSDDPRGAGLSASLLPLVLVGFAAGVILFIVGRPGVGQAVALVVASVLAGLVADAVTQGWLGIIGGAWLADAAVFGLAVFAIGSTVAGLGALLGRPGVGLGALLMVLVGNPWSGVSAAPELLPEPAGVIGQLLPPGAAGTLLRGTAFFDGARAAAPLVVLCSWAVFGLLALALGSLRSRASRPEAALSPAPAGRVRPTSP